MRRGKMHSQLAALALAVVGTLALAGLAAASGGLLGWWKGEDNALDSEDGHDGTLYGATFATGKVNRAFNVGQASAYEFGYVDLGRWSPGTQWTVEAWVNVDAVQPSNTNVDPPGDRRGIVGGIAGCRDWGIVLYGGEFGTVMSPPNPASCTSTVRAGFVATPGSWYHVVGTNNGTTAKIFVDGYLKACGDVYPNYYGWPFGTLIGRENWNNANSFAGLVDEVKIYDHALLAAEIGANTDICPGSVIAVNIDIKPGSFPNSINLGSMGTVPVAILSSATFDAMTVDPATVTLAGARLKLKGKGTLMVSIQDVNGDGLRDLVVHLSTSTLHLSATDTQAVLEGATFGGTPIRGSDTIRVVP